MAKVRLVMFWPNTISSCDGAFSRSAMARWASSLTASESRDVTKDPPELAFVRAR
jgi:hypothetical protein